MGLLTRVAKLEARRGDGLTDWQIDACRRAALLGFPAKDGESDEARLRRLEEHVREDLRNGVWA